MTQLEKIKQEILKLSPQEFAELRQWFFEFEWVGSDEKLNSDESSNKPDSLFDEALDA